MINNQANSTTLNKHTNNKLLELDRELNAYYLEHIPVNLDDLKRAYYDGDISEIIFQSHKLIPAMVLLDKQEIAESLRKLSDETISNKHLQSITEIVIAKIELTLETLKS